MPAAPSGLGHAGRLLANALALPIPTSCPQSATPGVRLRPTTPERVADIIDRNRGLTGSEACILAVWARPPSLAGAVPATAVIADCGHAGHRVRSQSSGFPVSPQERPRASAPSAPLRPPGAPIPARSSGQRVPGRCVLAFDDRLFRQFMLPLVVRQSLCGTRARRRRQGIVLGRRPEEDLSTSEQPLCSTDSLAGPDTQDLEGRVQQACFPVS